jgi:hypothetical protein
VYVKLNYIKKNPGNGAVTFKLQTEEGIAYTYQLLIAIDGDYVKFVAQDNLDDKRRYD